MRNRKTKKMRTEKRTWTGKLSKRNARDGYLLTLPLLAGCLVFYAIPFLMVLRNSVHHGIGYSEQFVGLSNYWSMLNNGVFRLAFGNTLRFLAVALPLILILSFSIALMLKEQVQSHQALKSVLLLPYIMPVVGSVLLVEFLFAQEGILNEGLDTLGLPVADWLNSEWAFPVVVLLYLWKNTGYAVILLLSGLVTISDEHYAAASLDGASRWQQLRFITIPQMWYSIFFAVVFSLINAFKCFREIFLIGGTHPNPGIYMLQHFINNAFEKLNYPKLAVASVLMLLVVSVFFGMFYRFVMGKEGYKE